MPVTTQLDCSLSTNTSINGHYFQCCDYKARSSRQQGIKGSLLIIAPKIVPKYLWVSGKLQSGCAVTGTHF